MTCSEFFKSNEQLAIPIQPGMRPLSHPSARTISRILLLGCHFLSPLFHMRNVFPFLDRLLRWLPCIPLICAKMLLRRLCSRRPLDYQLIQGRLKQCHIMPLCPAYDQRQRDSIPVDEQTSLAPIFFPDPLDLLQRLPRPWEL